MTSSVDGGGPDRRRVAPDPRVMNLTFATAEIFDGTRARRGAMGRWPWLSPVREQRFYRRARPLGLLECLCRLLDVAAARASTSAVAATPRHLAPLLLFERLSHGGKVLTA